MSKFSIVDNIKPGIVNAMRYFWPGIRRSEIRRFTLLAIVFACLLGAFWMLRLMKEAVFFKIAFPASLGWAPEKGRLLQPIARTLSLVVVTACIFIYSKLVDNFRRHQLFYIIGTFYTLLFGSMSLFLFIRTWLGDAVIGKMALASFGWTSFLIIESFGAIVIPLFWAFVNSVTTERSAKTGYPLIIAFGEAGAVGMSALNIFACRIGNVWPLFMAATVFLATSVLAFYYFINTTPKEQLLGNEAARAISKKRAGKFSGFFGGLSMLFTRPYLMGVFVIVAICEVASTIIDYQLNCQASVYPQYSSEVGFLKFLGIVGVCVNGLTLLLALFGTTRLMKNFGLRFCLLVYPVCLSVALTLIFLLYRFGAPTPTHMLWATFVTLITVKGLSFAVNNPAKEMMYIPTSKAAKFKAKGWIDMFGGRSSKMVGAQISNQLKHNLGALMFYGTLISLGLTGLWIIAAILVGRKHHQLVKDGKIIK